MLGTDLYAQSVLINQISALKLSRKFLTVRCWLRMSVRHPGSLIVEEKSGLRLLLLVVGCFGTRTYIHYIPSSIFHINA